MIDTMISQELDELLERAGKAGFVWWEFASGSEPRLAGVLSGPDTADVLVLHDNNVAHAYRTPAGPLDEVFRPDMVWWWFGGPPELTVRTLLSLPAHGAPGAPGPLMPNPAPTGVPGDLTPVRVRAPLWTAARHDGPTHS